MIASILFISFAILLFLGAPIAVCLGSSSILAMLVQGAGHPVSTIMSSLPRIFSASTSKFVLLAIPFFILAGNIMAKAVWPSSASSWHASSLPSPVPVRPPLPLWAWC